MKEYGEFSRFYNFELPTITQKNSKFESKVNLENWKVEEFVHEKHI